MKIMKRIVSVIVSISLFIILTGIADAAVITDLKHDLSSSSGGILKASSGEVFQLCSMCHFSRSRSFTRANLPLLNGKTTSSCYRSGTKWQGFFYTGPSIQDLDEA